MISARWFGLMALVGVGLVGTAYDAPVWAKPPAKAAKAAKAPKAPPPAPAVKTASVLKPLGMRLGLTRGQVTGFYDQMLDLDHRTILAKLAPASREMKEIEAEITEQKAAFKRSVLEFGTLPTGLDNTPLHGEYNYRNNETMMTIARKNGVTRYFFFENARLWKTYDTIVLPPPEPVKDGPPNEWCLYDCESWQTFKDVAEAFRRRLGVAGRHLAAEPPGRFYNEVDWIDGKTHIRLIDRSDESIVAIVFEEQDTAAKSADLRAKSKTSDEIDPTIQSVTRGGPVVDPNAHAADSYTGKAHTDGSQPAAPPPDAPKPKKK